MCQSITKYSWLLAGWLLPSLLFAQAPTYAPSLIGLSGGCRDNIAADEDLLVTAFARGLGATDSLGRTLVKPAITVSGLAAEVLNSISQNPFTDNYQVNFRWPSGAADDSIHPVVLSIGGVDSKPLPYQISVRFTNRSSAGSSAAGFPSPAGSAGALTTAMHCGGLAITTASGDARNPPVTLGGATVKVKDSAGVERAAQILYVSPQQVNYIIPSGTANGDATVTIASGNGSMLTGPLVIQSVTPALFQYPDSAIWDDHPFPVALLVRLRDGVQTVEQVRSLICDPMCRLGIDMGPDSDELFLILFGTGLRNRSSLANVIVKIGGVSAPVEYAGPQGEFPGLDQVNVRLPRSLAGRGGVPVELTVDGQLANETNIGIN